MTARRLAEEFTGYLKACKADDRALSTLPPGRFLMPGDLEGSPALKFAPLPSPTGKSALPDSLFAMMERRYEAYKTHVVKPFFREHIARLDRQIVLVDALQAMNAGKDAVQDLERALGEILLCFRPGKSNILSALVSRRIDRILVAATKADHLHHESHDRLQAIVRRLVERALGRADISGADNRRARSGRCEVDPRRLRQKGKGHPARHHRHAARRANGSVTKCSTERPKPRFSRGISRKIPMRFSGTCPAKQTNRRRISDSFASNHANWKQPRRALRLSLPHNQARSGHAVLDGGSSRMSSKDAPRRPAAFPVDDESGRGKPRRAADDPVNKAKPKPAKTETHKQSANPQVVILEEAVEEIDSAVSALAAPVRKKRRWSFGAVFAAAFGVLVSLSIGLWIRRGDHGSLRARRMDRLAGPAGSGNRRLGPCWPLS